MSFLSVYRSYGSELAIRVLSPYLYIISVMQIFTYYFYYQNLNMNSVGEPTSGDYEACIEKEEDDMEIKVTSGLAEPEIRKELSKEYRKIRILIKENNRLNNELEKALAKVDRYWRKYVWGPIVKTDLWKP